MEECAESLGQKSNNAASKDAQTKCGVAGYAGGIEHIAIHTMNPLRSDLHKTNATQTLPNENACRVIGGHLDRSSCRRGDHRLSRNNRCQILHFCLVLLAVSRASKRQIILRL